MRIALYCAAYIVKAYYVCYFVLHYDLPAQFLQGVMLIVI